jgi:hypothetical protein
MKLQQQGMIRDPQECERLKLVGAKNPIEMNVLSGKLT